MAESLVQRIALEGGEVVRSTLLQIGEVATQAFNRTREATVAASEAGQTLARSTQEVAKEFRNVEDSGKGVEGALGSIEAQGKNLLKTFGIAGASITAVLGSFSALASSASSHIKQATKTAETLGVTVSQYQAISLAARKAGVDTDNLIGVMSKFSMAVEKARLSDKEGKFIADLGVSLKDIGDTTDNAAERLELFAKGLKDSGASASQMMAALREVFGRSGAELAPMIKALAKQGLPELEEAAKRAGLVWTDTEDKMAGASRGALKDLKTAIENVKDRLGLLVMPAVTAFY